MRGVHKITPIIYRSDFASGYVKLLLYIMGERRCIGVRYINAATLILYRSAYPNSVIFYICLLIRQLIAWATKNCTVFVTAFQPNLFMKKQAK